MFEKGSLVKDATDFRRIGVITKSDWNHGQHWLSIMWRDGSFQCDLAECSVLPYKPKGVAKLIDDFKAYIQQHRDFFFTIFLVLIVDQVFLGGALRQKVIEKLNGALDGLRPLPGPEPKAQP